MEKTEPVTVYCPKCGRKVGIYDGRASVNFLSSCKNCRKLVIYDIATKETTVEQLPHRSCSSGKAFY